MGCGQWLREKLYDELLLSEDSFACKCRKLMAVMSFSAQLLPLVTIPYIISASYDETEINGKKNQSNVTNNIGLAVALAGLVFMFFFTFIPTYLYVRLTAKAPEWVFDILITVSNLALVPVTVGIKRFPTQPNLILFAIWAAFSGTPRIWAHLVLLSLHYFIAAYNDAIDGSGFQELLVPGAYEGHPGGLLLQQLIGYVNVGCLMFIAILMYRQLITAVESAQKAVELAYVVADQLVLYDTEGVRRTLEDYSGEVNAEADSELIQNFFRMADNLDEYRPHLPNWVLFKTTGEEDDEEDEGDIEDDETESRITMTVQSVRGGDERSVRSAAAKKKKPSGRDDDDESDIRSNMSRASGRSDGGRGKKRVGLDTMSVRSEKYLTGGAPEQPQYANAAQQMLSRGQKSVEAKVAMAILHFGFDDDCTLMRPERSMALGKFVERCGEIAAVTSGAIHSFVGGQLVISWGAYPLPRPESKAAQFMLALKRDSGHKAVNVYGACMTGRAEVQVVGGKKQQALTVNVEWWRDVQDCSYIAKLEKAICIDQKTKNIAGNDFESRICEVVLVPFRENAKENKLGVSGGQNGGSRPGSTQGMRPQSSGEQDQGSPTKINSQALKALQQGVFYGSNQQPQTVTVAPVRHLDKLYTPILLFSLLKEKVEEHDEWLYELERKKTVSPDEAVMNAVMQCLEGKFTEGVEGFSSIADRATLQDPHVGRLFDRANEFEEMEGNTNGRSFARLVSISQE